MKNPEKPSVLSVARFSDFVQESRGIIRVVGKLSVISLTLPEKNIFTDMPTDQDFVQESRGIIQKTGYRHYRHVFGHQIARFDG